MSDGLQRLVDDVRHAVRRGAGSIPPDFAGALARAHELAPERVTAVVGVDDPRVIDIRGGERGTPTSEAALDAIVEDSRAAVLRMVADQRMRSIPPAPLPARRHSPARWLVGGLLAAAAVLVAVGSFRFVEPAREHGDGATPDQAVHQGAGSHADGSAVEVEPTAPAPAPKRISDTLPEPAPLEPAIAAPEREPGKAVVRRAAGIDDDVLRRWSGEAHELWRKGDLRGAEQRFLLITKKRRRSVHAELAWADLFSLARQSGPMSRRIAHWTAYLDAFPRGRFADDARAGLCRARKEATCWSAYLRDLPRGSYRAEAESALAGAP